MLDRDGGEWSADAPDVSVDGAPTASRLASACFAAAFCSRRIQALHVSTPSVALSEHGEEFRDSRTAGATRLGGGTWQEYQMTDACLHEGPQPIDYLLKGSRDRYPLDEPGEVLVVCGA